MTNAAELLVSIEDLNRTRQIFKLFIASHSSPELSREYTKQIEWTEKQIVWLEKIIANLKENPNIVFIN